MRTIKQLLVQQSTASTSVDCPSYVWPVSKELQLVWTLLEDQVAKHRLSKHTKIWTYSTQRGKSSRGKWEKMCVQIPIIAHYSDRGPNVQPEASKVHDSTKATAILIHPTKWKT